MGIKVFYYDSLTSTSAQAIAILATKEVPLPFAVTATQQTSGRGRRGNVWHSPEGNLYLTLALNPPSIPAQRTGLIPIVIGTFLSRFLAERFGIHPTLKWPNDIVFAGDKLAGILCESSFCGKSWNHLIVGIGLNVSHSPKLSPPNRSTSLETLINQPINIKELANALATFMAHQWQKIDFDTILEKASTYALQQGHIWQGNHKQLYQIGMIENDGSLSLQQLGTGTRKKLYSEDSCHRWVFLGETAGSFPVITADCGNTQTKISLFRHARHDPYPEKIWNASDVRGLEAAIREVSENQIEKHWPVFYISVNPQKTNELKQILAAHRLSPVSIPKRYVRISKSHYALEEIGTDRIALLEGILEEYREPSSIIAISFGTATTIDLLSPERVHLGGWILPGINAYLHSLHQATSQLPELSPKTLLKANHYQVAEALGQNTESAIASGLTFSIDSLISRTEQWLLPRWPNFPVKILITGGAADYLEMPKHWVKNQKWIANGIRSMALGGIQP